MNISEIHFAQPQNIQASEYRLVLPAAVQREES